MHEISHLVIVCMQMRSVFGPEWRLLRAGTLCYHWTQLGWCATARDLLQFLHKELHSFFLSKDPLWSRFAFLISQSWPPQWLYIGIIDSAFKSGHRCPRRTLNMTQHICRFQWHFIVSAWVAMQVGFFVCLWCLTFLSTVLQTFRSYDPTWKTLKGKIPIAVVFSASVHLMVLFLYTHGCIHMSRCFWGYP